MTTKTKLHFSRFEFKYVLPYDLRSEIESELRYFLQLDPYVAQQPHKQYMVRSLYFDDSAFMNYYEKIDGMLHRAKFRLRTYTNSAEDGCATFLEVKGRHNALVFKHRVPLYKEKNDIFVPGDKKTVEKIIRYAQEGPVLERFKYELIRKRLLPVMLIDYKRRPYVSKYDAEFRLTFDDHLEGTHTRSLYPEPRENSRAILRGYTVMEVKFRYHMPSWFHRIIQAFGLRRVSVSKVCKGIEVCRLTPSLE